MDIHTLRGKRVTVMGLGINQGGLGVARFLARAGARVLVTDMKSADALASSLRELRKFRNITYVLGKHREQDFINADLIIQNPSVPRDSKYLAIARAHRTPIMTDVGLFLDLCPSKNIIAITGTKGKTTTTALIAAMCRAARKSTIVAGNIGVSVLDALAKITPKTTVVLELSSWQLEGIAAKSFAPAVAVLTNILPDHLDRYNGIEEYSQVKRSLIIHQQPTDIAVLYANDVRVATAAQRTRAQVNWFGKRRGSHWCAISRGWIVCTATRLSPSPDAPVGTRRSPSSRGGKGEKVETRRMVQHIMRVAEIPLVGPHNIMNVLAAITAARAAGVSPAAIRSAVRAFHGVPHRLEFVRESRGVRFINDSTATMPDATVAALRAFDRPIVLICGGKDKQLDFTSLIRALRGSHVRRVILLEHPAYTASVSIRSLAEHAHIGKKIIPVNSMREAVALAVQSVKRGDIVLLSPAAASFGMFANEFDRGDQFRVAVQRIR